MTSLSLDSASPWRNDGRIRVIPAGIGWNPSPGMGIRQAQLFRGRAGQAACQQLLIARSFSAFITVWSVKTLLNPNNSYFQNPQP